MFQKGQRNDTTLYGLRLPSIKQCLKAMKYMFQALWEMIVSIPIPIYLSVIPIC